MPIAATNVSPEISRKTPGIETPSHSRTLTKRLERTMKNESVTLMHAVALARNASSLRLWTMAYRGTIYSPPKNEIAKRQAVTARFWPEERNCRIVASGAPGETS